jgi:hypothetical protein
MAELNWRSAITDERQTEEEDVPFYYFVVFVVNKSTS